RRRRHDMSYDSYASLANALSSVGLVAQQASPVQLIVSTQHGPVWPDRGNSFWLSFRDSTWHLVTWSPVCYRIPPDQDVAALCLACMKVNRSAMYGVPDDIVSRFGLTEVTSHEFGCWFQSNPDTTG